MISQELANKLLFGTSEEKAEAQKEYENIIRKLKEGKGNDDDDDTPNLAENDWVLL